MSAGLTIAVLVVLGLIFLYILYGLVYFRISKRLYQLVYKKFSKQEIIRITTHANFFGIQSKGSAQARGNGALVLTRDELCFIRAVPQQENKVPVNSICEISMPRFFNGKSAFVPLLCIKYKTGQKEDLMAWAISDAKKWKKEIEKIIT